MPHSKRASLGVAVLSSVPLVCGCGARSGLDVPPIEEKCVPSTVTVQVPSTAPWTDAGVDVTMGQRLEMTATGMVHYGGPQQVTNANGGDFTGQLFFSDDVLPGAVVVSLIGKVGGTTAVGDGTPLPAGTPGDGAGFVGVSYDQVVPESGRLFLGFNDRVEAFGDNSGAFTVTITLSC